jgi:membrane-associated phospholipid phosphatase
MYFFAGLLILAVGLSRLFLGVHYPSDVLGGYAAGAVWMEVCITGVNIARHRQMDREHPASVAAGEQVGRTRCTVAAVGQANSDSSSAEC